MTSPGSTPALLAAYRPWPEWNDYVIIAHGNRIVHAIWGVNDRYPDHVIRVETFEDKFIKYTPQDFEVTAQRINEQVGAVSAFDAACRTARIAEASAR